jgi:DNA polymerase-3 subunit alpha
MGASSVAQICTERLNGKFTSLFDFCSRLGAGAINRRGLESLISAGAFDSLKSENTESAAWRANLFAAINDALSQGQRAAEDRLSGQSALFGAAEVEETSTRLPIVAPWTPTELATREKAAIGFYLSTHPLDTYQKLLAGMKLKNIADQEEFISGSVIRLAGMVSGLQVRTSKRGNRFAQFRFEDRSGGIKGVLLGENFNKLAPLLADDAMYIAEGNIEAPEGQDPTLKITSLQSLEDAEASRAHKIEITIPAAWDNEASLEELYNLLERQRGRTGVFINMSAGGAMVKLEAAGLGIIGTRALQRELESRGCSVEWVS